MNNIAKIARFIRKRPNTPESKIFLELAVALETGGPFQLRKLYELDHNEYKLATGLMDDWRLEQYYKSKLHLLDCAEFMESFLPS